MKTGKWMKVITILLIVAVSMTSMPTLSVLAYENVENDVFIKGVLEETDAELEAGNFDFVKKVMETEDFGRENFVEVFDETLAGRNGLPSVFGGEFSDELMEQESLDGVGGGMSGWSNNVYWEINEDGKLTVSGNGNWERSYDDYWNYVCMPWYYQREIITSAEVNLTDVTDLQGMFSECVNMISVDLTNLDTSKVTSMESMFRDCKNLTNINIREFDTSNVTDMSWMFFDCSNLISLDVSNFETSNVTNMCRMFSGCSSLTSLDVCGFDTSSVTEMGGMFCGCSSLTNLDVSKFDTSNVTDMGILFDECSSLTSLDVCGFDTSNVTDMSGMFNGCSSLTNLDVSKFDTSNVTDMAYMFKECNQLKKLNLNYFNTSNVTDMIWLFENCINLTYIDLSNFNMENVTAVEEMLSGCSSLTVIRTPLNCKVDVELPATFKDKSGNEYTMLPKNLSYSIELSAMRDSEAVDIVDSGWSNQVYWKLDSQGKLTISGNGDWERCQDKNGFNILAPWYSQRHSITSAKVDLKGATDLSEMFYECSNLLSVDLEGFNTERVTNMSMMFGYCSNLISLDLSKFDTSNVQDMSLMFNDCSSLISLDLSKFDTSNVQDMSLMFNECSSLISLDLSKFDTTNVTDMRWMFNNCSSLTSLDVSNFDTSHITDMHNAFYGCKNLTELNISNFDTSNVTDMSLMFWCCSSLTSLDISNFDTSNVTDMSGMFGNCSSLTGLDVSNFNTSNATNMSSMFGGCSLTSLDVSGFDTSNVTDMDGMFDYCSSLTSLDLSNFNTSNVTNMTDMFSDCNNLINLDVSNFDTSNVTEMYGMFYNCNSLTSLDISSFDVTNVIEWDYMFYGCDNLTIIYTPQNCPTDTIELPSNEFEIFIFENKAGNIYDEYFPTTTESIALIRSDVAASASESDWTVPSHTLKIIYTVTVDQPENGSILLDGGTISPAGTVSVNKGGSKTFLVKPESEEYTILCLIVDGERIVQKDMSKYIFADVTENHSFSAVIQKKAEIKTYKITVSFNGNGSASGNPISLKADNTVSVNGGLDETITFTPAAKYKVETIYITKEGSTSADIISVNAAGTVRVDYTVTGSRVSFKGISASYTVSADIVSDNSAGAASGGSDDDKGGNQDDDDKKEKKSYEIKVNVTGGGAEGSPEALSENKAAVREGADETITLKGNAGMVLESLKVDGKEVSLSESGAAFGNTGVNGEGMVSQNTAALSYTFKQGNGKAEITFKSVSANHTVEAVFAKQKVTVSINAPGLTDKVFVVGEPYGELPVIPDVKKIQEAQGQIFAGWMTKSGKLLSANSIVEVGDGDLVPIWQDYTIEVKQKIDLSVFFRDDIAAAEKDGAKYKYVVTVKTDAAGKYSAGEKRGENKLGIVAAKTAIFTAKKAGTVEVRLMKKKKGGKTFDTPGQKRLTVNIIKPAPFKQKTTLTYVNDTAEITELMDYDFASKLPNGSNCSEITYASSKESVLKVDKDTGKVTAVANGTAKVVVSYKTVVGGRDNVIKVSIPVTVKIPKFKKQEISVKAGKTRKTVLSNTLKGMIVAYSSSDAGIATVDAKSGMVTTVKSGNATIIATVINPDKTTSEYKYNLTVQ